MWGSLGDIVFELAQTPKSISDNWKFNFSQHKIINSYPKHEFLGEDVRTLTVEIKLHKKFCDPEKYFGKFISYGKEGRVCSLIIGPYYEGDFVITGVKRVKEEIDIFGNTVCLTLSVNLEEVREWNI